MDRTASPAEQNVRVPHRRHGSPLSDEGNDPRNHRTSTTSTGLGANGSFVLGPGRCGSTMLSDILNSHPRVLSLSEFLTFLGSRSFLPGKIDGPAYWRRLSEQTLFFRNVMTPENAPREFLYPRVNGRYPLTHVPPLLATTLPHLSDDPDRLFDELEEFVRHLPRQEMEQHHAALFDHLAKKFDRDIWIERSGLSLMYARIAPSLFPRSKLVFMFRDGRDVALSLQAFRPARTIIWSWIWLRRLGLNPVSIDNPWGRSRLFSLSERVLAPVHPTGWMLRTPPPLEQCAAFWSALTRNALACIRDLPTEQCHILRYERLTSDPAHEICKLMTFLGVDVSPDWLERAARIPEQREPRWKQLPPAQQRNLSEWTQVARREVDALT